MKRLAPLFLTVILLLPAALHAQVGKPRTDLAVGGGGGLMLNRVSFNPSIKQAFKTGMTMGLTARYTCEKYFSMICAFQGEVNYTQAGWKEVIDTSTDTYQRTVHYVQVPLLANLGFGRERGGVKGFLVVGPQLGFCIGETESRGGDWTASTLATRINGITEQYDLKVQNKFEYGITGGLGMDVSTRTGHHFILEGRYFFGLSDIFSNSKKDPFNRSANGSIVVKVSYLFDIIKTNL